MKIKDIEIDNFFDPVAVEVVLADWTKEELIELIKALNQAMVESLENWEGG